MRNPTRRRGMTGCLCMGQDVKTRWHCCNALHHFLSDADLRSTADPGLSSARGCIAGACIFSLRRRVRLACGSPEMRGKDLGVDSRDLSTPLITIHNRYIVSISD